MMYEFQHFISHNMSEGTWSGQLGLRISVPPILELITADNWLLCIMFEDWVCFNFESQSYSFTGIHNGLKTSGRGDGV
jgi:hypothetical protein